ncbi:RNA binding motif protein 12Ba isoform 1-T3 [Odontesthes bonariensis]|uniref:RNA binding motif protein 12Ba n=1 Tax=Odontesthes bonariensis TaxID=219752 RepID=UPI003F58A34F
MTIILRLQGLDVKAGTEDIRTFFDYLHIPDGGVYIVGGRLREAFIAFSNDRDAQLAIRQSGLLLKGSMVTLHISSMAELEQKLQSLLKKKTSALTVGKPQSLSAAEHTLNARSHVDNIANLSSSAAWPIDPDTANLPPSNAQHTHPDSENEPASSAKPLDSSTAFFLGLCTVLQGLKSTHTAVPEVDSPMADSPAALSEEVSTPEQTLNSKPGYVRLFGLSASTTKKDICHFFKGLTVQEAIVNVRLGPGHGCLAKFAKVQDAFDALRFDRRSLGSICVKVQEADEKMWTAALQECEQAFNVGAGHKPQQHSLNQSANLRNKSTSVLHLKRPAATQFPFKPSKRPKSVADPKTPLSQTMVYVVMVSNLPKSITKTEIKELFRCPNISHKNILHLLDKAGNTTDTSFVIFNSTEDFDYAMNLSGCHVGSGAIKVSSITKAEMKLMMAKTHPKNQRSCLTDPRLQRRSGALSEMVEVPPSVHQDQAAQMCLFVRNMPASVKKSQIKSLFCKDKLKMEDIVVLHDSEGNGIGEAVLRFESEKLAAHAQRIHGRDFLGTKVLLTRITLKQMEDILAKV